MRITKMFALILVVVFSASAFAVDGAATFKSRCVICHGPDGMGKTGPALKGTSLTADEIAALLSKGDDARKPPHKKPLASVSAEEARAVADYVKTLK
jgi:mono/diheme cytochrome c family protein